MRPVECSTEMFHGGGSEFLQLMQLMRKRLKGVLTILTMGMNRAVGGDRVSGFTGFGGGTVGVFGWMILGGLELAIRPLMGRG